MRTLRFLPLALLAAPTLFATTFIVPTDDELARRADAIVVATVLSSHPGFIEDGTIMTSTETRIERVIAGPLRAGDRLVTDAPGGRVGQLQWTVHGAPQFEPGERVLLFLFERKPGRWATVDLAVGKFEFELDARGRQVLIRQEGDLSGWDAELRPFVDRRRAAEPFLRYLIALRAGRPLSPDYFVEAAPLIQPESDPPSLEGAVGADAVVPPATNYLMAQGGNNFRWTAFPGQVVFRNYFVSGSVAGADTATAMATAAWTGDCGSNINLAYGGGSQKSPPAGQAGGPDGENTVRWEVDLAGVPDFTCSGGGWSGVLGIGGPKGIGGPHTYEGMTYYAITEGDVDMNRGIAACGSLPQRVKNISVAHEMGHALNFRHSDKDRDNNSACAAPLPCSNFAIMTASVPSSLDAVLQPWDVDAARAVYPGGTCGGGAPPGSGKKGDFNGDSRADLIWRHRTTGQNSFWFLNGAIVVGGGSFNPVTDTGWVIGGTADFNGDLHTDILWHHRGTGANTVWFMNGSTYVSQVGVQSAPAGWRPVAAGDLNGDGNPDIVWRNLTNGANSVWFMSGTTATSAANLPAVADLSWEIVGSGDVNGDGRDDIVLWSRSAGSVVAWFMNGATRTSQAFIGQVADLGWRVAAVGDFSGDGRADLLWNHAGGSAALWTLNGGTVTGGGFIGAAGTGWDIAGPR